MRPFRHQSMFIGVEVLESSDSSDDEGVVERKRKRKKEKDPLQATKRSKGRNEVVAEPSFFADL